MWFCYYHLLESRRIDDLRKDLDDLDRATMTAYAFNAPKEIETRRNELRARLRNDPASPSAPQFTMEEMNAAARRLMAKHLNASSVPVS